MDDTLEVIDKSQKYFLGVLSSLVVLGVVMVYSSSYIYARDIYGNSSHYFYRQLFFIGIGAPMCWIISKTKISFWLKYSWFFHLIVTLLLIATFIPGLGNQVKGANRWLYVGGFGLQPGEFVKITSLLVAVPFFEGFFKVSPRERMAQGLFIVLPMIVLLIQPDFGSFSISLGLVAVVCFLSSFPRKYFYSAFAVGVLGIIPILISQPYRVRRLFAYLDPWKNPQTSGFQIIQSYLAFANGSIFGTGLGNSNEKLFYLPEAHNDFIFSVIGEELGFMGVFAVVSLFLGLIFFGFRLVTRLEKKSSTILATAIIFTIGFQATLNMGVVLGLLPTKGLNLPFISAGGSSLIANFFAIGLFLSAVTERKKTLITHNSFEQFSTSSSSYINDHQTFTNSPSGKAPDQGELF
ncbi:MAG: putative lipid II flippase FtsW [Bacteriovoracaceae bacterium]|nr:putative lipid II flippase FtsW [Bacteriovoracaceae bacterium]